MTPIESIILFLALIIGMLCIMLIAMTAVDLALFIFKRLHSKPRRAMATRNRECI